MEVNTEQITWHPVCECSKCNAMFPFQILGAQLSVEQLINGPYPNINLQGNTINCPICNARARVLDYTPEKVKEELLAIRDLFLEAAQQELSKALEIMQNLNPTNYNELVSALRNNCPSISEILGGFKETLNWICLLGGSWAFFKEIERLLK